MKITCVLAGMITIMLCHGACRTSKISSRQKAQLAFEMQSDVKSKLSEDKRFERTKSVIDSSGQSFQLTIFPVDSFKFSLQNGFVGKATKVIVKGSNDQMIRISDTIKSSVSLNSESETKLTSDFTEKMKDKSSQVERRTVVWKGICLGLIAGMVILWIWRKLRMLKFSDATVK